MKWLKKNWSSIVLAFIFFIGLSLLLYPSFSDYWNSFHQSRAIASYTEFVTQIDETDYEKMWNEAQQYNESLWKKEFRWALTEEEAQKYHEILNINGTGVMGYIEIPTIGVSLPIYHGVDESILQVAVGHLEGSSIPVGGKGTHCVLSGHRGLPSAKLFTDIDQLKEGDVFMLHILNDTLSYEVDQIRIVNPDDLTELEIEEGKDLCTLITCTPYGVNSHRLLVRGHRIENLEKNMVHVTADAVQIEPELVAPFVAIPILLVLLIWLCIRYRKRK